MAIEDGSQREDGDHSTQIHRQHGSIRRQTDRLLDIITLEFSWDEVSLALAKLDHTLTDHFEHEESSSHLEAVRRLFPKQAEKLTTLLSAHGGLAETLKELRTLAEARSDKILLKKRFLDWLSRIREHEREETALLKTMNL